MRIVVGFLFFSHGAQKLFGFPGGMPPGAPSFIIYGAGSIEFLGGLLVMLGLFTHWAAFINSGQMAFAYWIGHGTSAVLPIQNNGELAALYCFVFLFISKAAENGAWIRGLRRITQSRIQDLRFAKRDHWVSPPEFVTGDRKQIQSRKTSSES